MSQATETDQNPHSDDMARRHSCYTRGSGNQLVYATARPDAGTPPPLAGRVHGALQALILDPEFPCVGARSALNQGSYRFAMYDELNGETATAGLARDLYTFVQEQPDIDGEFTTFIASFDTPKAIDPMEFERLLWAQLDQLHSLDRSPWDAEVSRDSEAPKFCFSFAGRAFFIVGLSPAGERWARAFPWPTLAFNAHFQFEQLRERGQFERLQDVIRERDVELEGNLNPNLSNFGDHTEARQYSGRAVEPEWRCPVRFE